MRALDVTCAAPNRERPDPGRFPPSRDTGREPADPKPASCGLVLVLRDISVGDADGMLSKLLVVDKSEVLFAVGTKRLRPCKLASACWRYLWFPTDVVSPKDEAREPNHRGGGLMCPFNPI